MPCATNVRMDCAGRIPLLRSGSESETRFWLGVLMSSVGMVLRADYLPEQLRAIDILHAKPGAQGGIRGRNTGIGCRWIWSERLGVPDQFRSTVIFVPQCQLSPARKKWRSTVRIRIRWFFPSWHRRRTGRESECV